jgi:hypothetical protein
MFTVQKESTYALTYLYNVSQQSYNPQTKNICCTVRVAALAPSSSNTSGSKTRSFQYLQRFRKQSFDYLSFFTTILFHYTMVCWQQSYRLFTSIVQRLLQTQALRDLRFSRRRWWRFMSSGMLRHVNWYTVTERHGVLSQKTWIFITHSPTHDSSFPTHISSV